MRGVRMSSPVRVAAAVVLLVIVALCVYLAVAAREAASDDRLSYWIIYGAAGLACLAGAVWLLRSGRPRA
jgi:hypothetical protein